MLFWQVLRVTPEQDGKKWRVDFWYVVCYAQVERETGGGLLGRAWRRTIREEIKQNIYKTRAEDEERVLILTLALAVRAMVSPRQKSSMAYLSVPVRMESDAQRELRACSFP